jgi:radical SAM protein with 4Fe4S-binding SPASM domain
MTQENKRLKDCGAFPNTVLLDTTSYCDLRCSMCGHVGMERKKGKMSWALYTKIIDEIAEINKDTRVWMIFFGEPFLLKKTTLYPMIKYAKDKGLSDVVTNTNANLMDRQAAKDIIESGLDAIYIGIDAFSAETYEKYRVGGNYETVVNNVSYLLELKKELKADKPEVFVQFVEMDGNRAEIEGFRKFWHEKGAVVKIRPMVSWAGLVDAPTQKKTQQERYPCYWAMQTMSITDDGKVVLCAVDVDARFVAGDVNKDSLQSVWNGELKKIRAMHQEKQFDQLPSPCKGCGDWQAARADFY